MGAIWSFFLLISNLSGAKMVTSIILINVERTRINETAEQLAEMEGISEVYSVSGAYDLVAIVRVPNNDDLSELVTKKLLNIGSILKSETMLAFKAFSRHDLESMFAVGM
jgi:DNA-binding Lrp family transcriptional regulator